jgi:uncharacterized protein (DUF1684 family)
LVIEDEIGRAGGLPETMSRTLRMRGPGGAWRGDCPRRGLLWVLAAAGASMTALAGCSPQGQDALPYADRIAAQREAKDEFFKSGADSPVTEEGRDEFLPLSYFAIDEEYVAAAVLAPSTGEPAIEMPTSTGQRRHMRRAGTLKFALKGQPLELTAFVEADDLAFTRLFVPFGDLTNGAETYPAGRYLDLTRMPSGIYQVDFNQAYTPYCYYNPVYDCPYPPAENRLKVPVRAGERTRPLGSS